MRDYLHFIPFILYFVIEINTIYPIIIDLSFFDADLDERGISIHRSILYMSRLAQLFAYLVASFVVVWKYRKKIRDFFSDLQEINLNWLYVLLCAMGVLWSAGLVTTIVFLYFPEYSRVALPLPFLGMSVIIYIIGYYALLQPDIYAAIHGMKDIIKEDATDAKRKYAKNAIPETIKTEYVEKIMACFNNEKVFLNPSLTLRDLSDKTDIPIHSISQVLTESVKDSFYSLVNKYRVEYAKALLQDDNSSIIEICFKSGFNSKSAFNNAFKRHSGISPSDFRKKFFKCSFQSK
jgi:AraC-like DNA-binding protein